MKFSVFQISRKGGREKNEDRMGYCYTKESGLFLLADGMGGHPEGEVAAQTALQIVSSRFQQEAKPLIADVEIFFASAILAAHRQILRYAAEKGLADTPRTTLVAVIVQNGMAYWVHCGDSRLYFVRQGELLARTTDHSYLEMQKVNKPSGTSSGVVNRNVLYTCLGSPIKPVFEITGPLPLLQGDRILLCSDGLWGSLDDADIVYHLGHKPVGQAVPELAERALIKAGASSDNVTIIALEWETPNPPPAQPSEADGKPLSTLIEEGAFSSTVQTGWLDTSTDDLDDAAIERSIAEIKDAIRRTAARKA